MYFFVAGVSFFIDKNLYVQNCVKAVEIHDSIDSNNKKKERVYSSQ